jgi:mono/diheme cytochrome c family protein
MSVCRKALFVLTLAPLALALPAQAQQPQPTEHKGLTVIKAKCFQCHTDSMWRDQRQDTRAWEATLYRMVGRGGLWTTDEIKLMADYLGTDFGPNVPPITPAR